jgi:hypothetical protein
MPTEETPESDSDEEDPRSKAQHNWTEYDPTEPNHYRVSYLDEFSWEQTCPYICYIYQEGVSTVQGCVEPHSTIYGNILHPRPAHTPADPVRDATFTMFHPHLTQCLLINNAITSLDDIGVVAKVARYRASHIEEHQQKIALARAEDGLRCTTEKKLSAEGYLFHTGVVSRISHLILDPSQPLSPCAPTPYPRLDATQGPSDDGWGNAS